MKKSTKIITIGLVSTVLLASLILIITVLLPKIKKEENEIEVRDTLEKMTIDHYENHFLNVMPEYLETHSSLTITLDYLQSVKKDISLFEKYSCDYDNTYAKIIADGEDGEYKVEVTLDCKFD